jgi:hypothetical protein
VPLIGSPACELVLEPIQGKLLQLLEEVLGIDESVRELHDLLTHDGVGIDVIRPHRARVTEVLGLVVAGEREQIRPFLRRHRSTQPPRLTRIQACLLRLESQEQPLGARH